MPMPKSKITRSRRGARRSHSAIVAGPVHNCPNCGAPTRPHNVCASCGYYKSREVIPPKN